MVAARVVTLKDTPHRTCRLAVDHGDAGHADAIGGCACGFCGARRDRQTNLVMPGRATTLFGGSSPNASFSGISTSWLFHAWSQVMRWPV